MGTIRSNKRSQLVQAAGNLVHRRGFSRTTLADIAQASGVRLGNVYYYFKTKSAIGQAIVEQRAGDYQKVLSAWDELPDPIDRIDAFIQSTCDNRTLLARSGCPIGTLCVEMRKEEGPLAKNAAKIFAQILAWLEVQFRSMGRAEESRGLAEHLVAALQGASLLAHVFGRPEYVVEEAQRLRNWIDGLMPGRRTDRLLGARRPRRRNAAAPAAGDHPSR
jgi:TetR/AcrR family transcriptional regulator, transcriptional repressor for nem operon